MCTPLPRKLHENRVYNFFIFVCTYYLAHSRYLISIVKWNEWNIKKGRQIAGSDRTIHSISNIFSVESLFPLAVPLLSDICIVLLTFQIAFPAIIWFQLHIYHWKYAFQVSLSPFDNLSEFTQTVPGRTGTKTCVSWVFSPVEQEQ